LTTKAEHAMELDETTLRDVVVRLRKVQGQLGGLVQMLEAGRDCKEIITQLAAASRALDRVGFRIVASGLKECVAGASAGSPQAEIDRNELERLFLALA
jgi:Uncharacterized protein conserved in bacteria